MQSMWENVEKSIQSLCIIFLLTVRFHYNSAFGHSIDMYLRLLCMSHRRLRQSLVSLNMHVGASDTCAMHFK